MSAGTWLVVGACVCAFLLCIAGAGAVAIEAMRTVRRTRRLSVPSIDFAKAGAAVEKLREDAAKMALLERRAQAAFERLRREREAMKHVLARVSGGNRGS
jgi:hypothetical protein